MLPRDLVGIAAAHPGLLVDDAGAGSFAVFNILLVRAVFAWIDRWLAQRRTREILTRFFWYQCCR